MSRLDPVYPPPRYDGPGEISATYRPVDTEPDLRFAGGGGIHYLATRSGTDGDAGLYRVDMGPGRSGTGTHFHATISEGEAVSFLMLFTPGADREGYFEELPALAGYDDAERAAFFARHDTFFADTRDGPAGDALTRRR